MADIIFTNMMGIEEIFPPEPAFKNIPNWYKDLESYIGGEKKPSGDGNTTGTIKRCMPVFDVMNAGYIIKTPADVFISQRETFDDNGDSMGKRPWYEWANFGLIAFHPVDQAPNHPNRNGHQESYPKWINPWAIKTPPGYSVLFVQPFHRPSDFTILPAVVDTDTYSAPVNFPFVLNDVNFEGIIPAGTAVAQVIPFQREDWQMSIGKNEDVAESNKVTTKLRTRFFDSYKTQYRQTKEYR
jgi:hypothetical protein